MEAGNWAKSDRQSPNAGPGSSFHRGQRVHARRIHYPFGIRGWTHGATRVGAASCLSLSEPLRLPLTDCRSVAFEADQPYAYHLPWNHCGKPTQTSFLLNDFQSLSLVRLWSVPPTARPELFSRWQSMTTVDEFGGSFGAGGDIE